ncbi:hypothetical protein AUK22_03910 [bacterium CG2_30_54_10]|nr:MAG: hypothetical protein AUK22_03910 [bacterium CG2_30_54_10]
MKSLLVPQRRTTPGTTLVEIMIVVALCSLISGVVYRLMAGFQRTFLVGSGMMDNQSLMETIIYSLRKDVRQAEEDFQKTANSICFLVTEDTKKWKVTYTFDLGEKTLSRSEDPVGLDTTGLTPRKTDFHSQGQILAVGFQPIFGLENGNQEFQRLDVLIYLKSQELHAPRDSKMSFIGHFGSWCWKKFNPLATEH